MYESYTQSRKWLLTINNPQDHGMTHDEIIDRAQKFNPDYMCLADEIGEEGTYHTHLFLYSSSPMRFGTVKKRFPTAHIDRAHGTVQDNRAYIRKEGKWLDDAKAETSVEGSFYEFGTVPSEVEERDPKMYRLLQNVKDGLSTTEIIDEVPSFAFKSRDIDVLREAYLAEKYRVQNRLLTVTYLFGASGTGKTSLPYAFGKFVEKDSTVVSVQPSWRERTELYGYFNEFTKRFNETEVLKKMYEATFKEDIFITVLDEMNIARVEYYFAELLSILEMPSRDEWVVDLVPSGWANDPKHLDKGRFRLPQNMWFIGTANTDDSTYTITDKVYDRAIVIDFREKFAPITSKYNSDPIELSSDALIKLFDEARENDAYKLTKTDSDKFFKICSFVKDAFIGFRINDAIDILLLTLLFTFAVKFLKNRKAGALIIGITICLLVFVLATIFEISGIRYILSGIFQIGVLAIVIIFQPEIRDLLEKMGLDAFNEYVDRLDRFLSRTDATIKSHYSEMLKWYMQDNVNC